MKIGNTTFNPDSVKGMTLKKFKAILPKNAALGMEPEEAYEKLTGKKQKKDAGNVRKAD